MSKQFPEPEKSSISFIRDLIEAEKMANFVNSNSSTGVLHSIENLPNKPQQIENIENHCSDLNNKNSMSNIIFVVDSIGNVTIKKNGNLYKESESEMLMEINKNEITADENKNNNISDIGLPQNNDFVENNVMKELPKVIKTLNVNATPFDYEKFKSEFEKINSEGLINDFVVKEYENENTKHDVTPDLDQRNDEQAKSQLTKDLIEHSKLLSDRSREESVLNYLSTVEITCPQNHDGLIDLERTSSTEDDEQLGNLSESEEDDELKPLMIDNHTTVEHHEFYVLNYPKPNTNNTDNIANNNDANNNEFSSAESDLSTQYDHRDMTTLSQHSSEDYKDSGMDMISLPIHKAKKIIAESVAPPPTPASATSPRLNNSVERMDNQISNDNDIDDEIKEIDTLSPMEVPDEQMSENIVEQVEFYFSNESLLKDAFLLKHVKRNKEGFVSLKLISSFKRVRQYTKDWRVVGHAIRRKSNKTELNDLGTKVRRLEPLPSFDETMPSRTIVVSDLPFAKLSIENISEIFSKCGEIALIRILRPGMQIPVDVRQFMNKYPEMQQKECALVEYLDSQSARNAKNLNSNGVNFKIYEMVAPKKKTGKKSITTITKFVENYKYSDNNFEKNRGGQRETNTFNYHDENRYNTRRNSSEYFVPTKPQTEHQMRPQQPTIQHSPQMQNYAYQPPHMTQRRYSTNSQDNQINHYMNHLHSNHSNMHYNQLSPRRISNCSVNSNTGDIMMNHNRKYSSCSDGYSSCSELSRRPSTCSSSLDPHSRRTSCSEHCPCGSPDVRRMSNIHRKISECSEQSGITRRISNSSLHGYDRDFHNDQQQQYPVRKISSDSINDRKISSGSAGSNYSNHGNYYDNNTSFRKYSNGFDPNRKLSNTDQYYMGRRISTDSGYDRRMSFGSEYSSSPRSRTNSFLSSMPKSAEVVVRTPIGPDGSKGFASRARKIGQVTSMQSQTAVN